MAARSLGFLGGGIGSPVDPNAVAPRWPRGSWRLREGKSGASVKQAAGDLADLPRPIEKLAASTPSRANRCADRGRLYQEICSAVPTERNGCALRPPVVIVIHSPNDVAVIMFRMQERDLDLFILEELHSSSGFSDWLAEQIGLVGFSFVEATHSVSAKAGPKWGETDVLAFFQNDFGRVAVLIEDKIAASFQDRQAERYRERAQEIVASGQAQTYKTVLIAPKTYLIGVPQDDPWDHRLSINALMDWFEGQDGSHAKWRSKTLYECLDRNKRTLSSSGGAVSRVSKELSHYIEINFKEFYHQAQNSDNSWGLTIGFINKKPYIQIVWKLNQNCVDLILEKQHLGKLEKIPNHERTTLLLRRDTNFKCDIMRIHVGNATWSDSLANQLEVANEVIDACQRLRLIATEIGSMPSVIQEAPELPAA